MKNINSCKNIMLLFQYYEKQNFHSCVQFQSKGTCRLQAA